MDAHFGCNIFYFESGKEFGMGDIMSLLAPISIDKEDTRWKQSISFFMSIKTEFDLEFGKAAEEFEHPILDMVSVITGSFQDKIKRDRESMPFIYAKILDFWPSVTELKIYDNGIEDKKQEDTLNIMIGTIKDFASKPEFSLIT